MKHKVTASREGDNTILSCKCGWRVWFEHGTGRRIRLALGDALKSGVFHAWTRPFVG